jgi:hypothetical protein
MTAEKVESNRKDILLNLPPRVGGHIINVYFSNSPEMPLKRMAELARVSKRFRALLQPALDDAKAAFPLLINVVHADRDALITQVLDNPALLFKKGQVTDPAGQTFYNVSAYQLMTFLCDGDMKSAVMLLIPEVRLDLKAQRRRQYAEIDSGGADLVKMDRDPTQLKFVDITRFKTRFTMPDLQQKEVELPLLENPDGIIFYQDTKTQKMHLYYANKTTQTITLINLSKEQRHALASLFASFAAMENNSSRRSNNQEHELIAGIMQRTLSRKGIVYVDPNGRLYRDNRIEFRYINNARTCIRLDAARRYNDADAVWRLGVGGAERQVLWLLARVCERNRPFYPLPNFNAPPFERSFIIFNYLTNREESVFSAGKLVVGLGQDFAIYKAWRAGCV